MSFREIKVKSMRYKKSFVHNTKFPPANPEKSIFERKVLQVKADVAKEIENIPTINSFESHCFNVFSRCETRKGSSLMSHLEHTFSHMAASSLVDQNYPTVCQYGHYRHPIIKNRQF